MLLKLWKMYLLKLQHQQNRSMNRLIFATKNKGKVREVRNIFNILDLEILSLLDLNDNTEVIEDGSSFEENAFKKAREIFIKYQLPVIADDSGIMVEQINWEPGIYSARYAGENATDHDNNMKLIKELSSLPEPHNAKYVCAAVFYDGKDVAVAKGEVYGVIVKEPKGSNGFGYDPYFKPEGYQLTMAELDADEKDKISHRGKAFRKLKELVTSEL